MAIPPNRDALSLIRLDTWARQDVTVTLILLRSFIPFTTMTKKRKLSDLTTQETSLFLRLIENFKQDLSEEDDDEISVIASLDHVVAKLQEIHVSHPQLPLAYC